MISLKQLKTDLTQKWQRFYLSCGLLDENQRFPLTVSLKSPNNQTILDDWQSVKSWAASYAALNQTDFKLEWQKRITPLGKQELPMAAVFLTVTDLAHFLKKHQELTTYCNACEALIKRFPGLRDWCLKYPKKVLQEQAGWGLQMDVLAWFLQHPAPDCYLREIALPGVDSKFIEVNKVLLDEWLHLLQAPLNKEAKNFEARWGIKTKPDRMRLRFLGDESIAGLKDLEAPFEQVNQVDWIRLGIERVFITENEINFLTFPLVKKSLVLFGKGYGFEHWRAQSWLRERPIFYWGDIDTHGFAILSQLRGLFPQVVSILMDQSTLLAYRSFWVEESRPSQAEKLAHLTQDESLLYGALVENRWQPKVRLEQERIPLGALKDVLKRLGM
ncbi:MAG: hypothetical protein JXR44_09775 [Thiotrichales bacterium]|nr:hypothetical protein [Thiotrichales bacterium]